jgi:hypothetical protein
MLEEKFTTWVVTSRKVSKTAQPSRSYKQSLAPTFKLIGNSLVLGAMEVIAESFTLAEKSGIGHELAFDLLKGPCPFNHRSFTKISPRPVSRPLINLPC